MKYELNQTVFYLKNNKLHSANVLGRKMVEMLKTESGHFISCRRFNAGEGDAEEKEMKVYLTCHGEFDEEVVFASKEDLLNSL